ncbi:MAG: hypothetical protein FWG38_03070 [Defluviitaleaceae bacterium]|nr:hypothetical protein [Defluviitaleaceae bacterium]
MRKHKKWIIAGSIIILLVLLIPIPSFYDGGPDRYRALVYTIDRWHSGSQYHDGELISWDGSIQVRVFNRTVFRRER